MQFLKDNWKGIILCFALSLPCWFLGKAVPVVGAPVFGILLGMALMRFLPAREQFQSGIGFRAALHLHPRRFCNMRSFCWASV